MLHKILGFPLLLNPTLTPDHNLSKCSGIMALKNGQTNAG